MAAGGPVGKLNAASVFSSFLLLPTDSELVIDVAWTLRHGMFFYLLFGLAIIYGSRIAKILIFRGAAAILATPWISIPSREYLMRFILSPYNLEFILGISVAHLWRSRPLSRILYPTTLMVGMGLMCCFLMEGCQGLSDLNFHLF